MVQYPCSCWVVGRGCRSRRCRGCGLCDHGVISRYTKAVSTDRIQDRSRRRVPFVRESPVRTVFLHCNKKKRTRFNNSEKPSCYLPKKKPAKTEKIQSQGEGQIKNKVPKKKKRAMAKQRAEERRSSQDTYVFVCPFVKDGFRVVSRQHFSMIVQKESRGRRGGKTERGADLFFKS